jgi:hypothetical protein
MNEQDLKVELILAELRLDGNRQYHDVLQSLQKEVLKLRMNKIMLASQIKTSKRL